MFKKSLNPRSQSYDHVDIGHTEHLARSESNWLTQVSHMEEMMFQVKQEFCQSHNGEW